MPSPGTTPIRYVNVVLSARPTRQPNEQRFGPGRESDSGGLRFERDGEVFRDKQTGSSWNIRGEAVDGPHAGAQLRRLTHVDTFWFAWAAFLPDTEVVPPVSR